MVVKPFLLLLVVLVLPANRPALAQPPPQDAYGITAYRPQHGTGYHPFARTAVPEGIEEHRQFGPGIRVNRENEIDPEGEDDLIELIVARPSTDETFILERSAAGLRVWTRREKLAQTEVSFADARSTRLDFGDGQQITLWVEWTGAAPAYPVLSLLVAESNAVVDRIVFHTFTGLVVALGGERQEPQLPIAASQGTFQVATALYEQGWDVLMRNENDVREDGTGPVYAEVVNAIRNRSVRKLAIFGYSHGGGSTYDLCELLNIRRDAIGDFSVNFTSYVDAVENDSDIDTDAETRRPPMSEFHLNHYQHASEEDFRRVQRDGLGLLWALGARILDGGPVAGSTPPPHGLDVESTGWGMNAHHYDIDDFNEVLDLIRMELTGRMSR